MVLIGDNDQNLVVVNIERWLEATKGTACQYFSKHPINHDLTSSIILTDNNRLIMPAGQTSYAGYDLSLNTEGYTSLEPVWKTRLAWLPIGVSVHLAFENAEWIAFYHIGRQQPYSGSRYQYGGGAGAL